MAPASVVIELSAQGGRRLWLDAGRGTAGLCLLDREQARTLESGAGEELSGRSRQVLLQMRKQLVGRRLSALRRVAGERTLVIEAGDRLLALRLGGPAPALTLAVEGGVRGTLGDGAPAWPLPPDDPSRDWDRLMPDQLRDALERAAASGRTPLRALLSAWPSLGPFLGRLLAGSPELLEAWRKRLRQPSPHLLAPGPLDACHDADLAPRDAVALGPFPLELPGRHQLAAGSWNAAAVLFLSARRRGDAFERSRQAALSLARRELRRLRALAFHLEHDRASLPSAAALRRQAEALLAAPGSVAPGAVQAELADPYEPGVRLVISLDPRINGPANADRLFQKARRLERGRAQLEARLAETQGRLAAAEARENRLLAARDLGELGPRRPQRLAAPPAAAGPRHYLTSRGLSLLVGRGARENQRLTFSVAGPEDLWLHARDVPGAHVVLRDAEGRAVPDDRREAAEVAAFFSEARGQLQVDVHVTRRKHLRPARGGPGGVRFSHTENLRVTPRDPEGRLRKR